MPSLAGEHTIGRWLAVGAATVLGYVFFLHGHVHLPSLLAESTQRGRRVTPRQQIGVQAVEQALGRRAPYGRGVPIGHVEGELGDYVPNTRVKAFQTVGMTPRSGPSKISGHAQATARVIYGPQGMAPGINDVYFYTTTHWMGGGCLHAGTDQPPEADGRRVFTHSWIGMRSGGSDVLRRVDYLIDHAGVIMTVGVNNNRKSRIPPLLASGYNVIAVGVTHGNSSGGYTWVEGPGRCKPDLVAPKRQTSYSTPLVAALVARLLEAADRMTGVESADRPEVIKAVLMAGAEKPKGWHRQSGKPLDEHLGAGSVRFDQSLAILDAGPQPPANIDPSHGWDYRSIRSGQQVSYVIDTVEPRGEASIMLVWHRRIDGRVARDLLTQKKRWLDLPRVANLDLNLHRLDDDGQRTLVQQSASTVDNVEHVYLDQLQVGRYVIEVTRQDRYDDEWGYALAWRVEASSPELLTTKQDPASVVVTE